MATPAEPGEEEAVDRELFDGERLFAARTAAEVASDYELLLLGTSMFVLLSSWSSWVERRVEQVEFVALNTVKRSISVDLYVPNELVPLQWPAPEDQRMYAVPVAMYTKRRLNQFSLRDGAGAALPLLARRHNVAIGAATLVAAARAWVGKEDVSTIPETVLEDLWSISSLERPRALGVWRALGRPLNPEDDTEREWRQAMIVSPEFMALAFDLAQNFVVSAIVTARAGDRRLIKFSYREPSRLAARGEPTIQPRDAEGVRAPRESATTSGWPETAMGRLHIRARITRSDAGKHDAPAADVRYIVAAGDRRYFTTTSEAGQAVLQAEVGTYQVVEEELPPRLFPTSPVGKVTIEQGQDTELKFEYCRRGTDPASPRVLGRAEWLRRTLFRAPKPIEINAPSVGHAYSYHLEFEAPTGMQITRARLVDASAYITRDTAPGEVLDETALTAYEQRAHVHASQVGQERRASGEFLLRPRDVTVLRPAARVGLLSLILLALLVTVSAFAWWDAGEMNSRSPAMLATLLLVVPGGLSAYISRGSAHQFTERALVTVRLLALSNGLWAFGAAALLAVADLTSHDGFADAFQPWRLAFIVLIGLTLLQALSLWVLRVALRRSIRPPEWATT